MMHGLIFTAIQSFFATTHGRRRWQAVTSAAGVGMSDYEAMLTYDDDQLGVLLTAICDDLRLPRQEVLEDLGTYLVSHPQMESLRRLLRFGGETYLDFLHSLDDLPDRARLAVSDLDLPPLELREVDDGLFSLTCRPGLPSFASVMVGVLRAMADDYGALAILEYRDRQPGGEVISIALVESAFSRGRDFDLGARVL